MIIRTLPSFLVGCALLLVFLPIGMQAFQPALRTRGSRLSSTFSSSSSLAALTRLSAATASIQPQAERSIVWFTSGDLRLHDNEALSSSLASSSSCIPLFIFDPSFLSTLAPHLLHLYLLAIADLRNTLSSNLITRIGPVEQILPAVMEETSASSLWVYEDITENQRALVHRGLSSLSPSSSPSLKIKKWTTRLRSSITGGTVGNNWEKDYLPAIKGKPIDPPLPPPSLPPNSFSDAITDKGRLPSFEELLELAYGHEEDVSPSSLPSSLPPSSAAAIKQARVHAAREEYWTPTYYPHEAGNEGGMEGGGGESLALKWLKEYMEVGPVVFGERYLPSSGEGLERQVMRRLIAAKGYEGLFDGEVFTRAFSPLLAIGAISPRYLASLLPALPPSFPFFLLDKATKNAAMVKEVVERREWHQILAERDVVHFPLPETEALTFKYWRFHGHNVRYAVSRVHAHGTSEGGKEGTAEGNKSGGNGIKGDGDVPTLLLVHGFGASSDQWSKCFEALSGLARKDPATFGKGFRIFALDLLGFGHSEKPSVTYTQYLWQDQVRDFALEVVQSPFFIAGNSIGGFTAASVAADIGPMCQGLILVNTAGKVVSPEEYAAELASREGRTVEESTRSLSLPSFSGPPKVVLTAFSAGLFWYLQPRVEKICKDLYRHSPQEVGPRLVNNIIRDSCDPGALGVFASGGRLPVPRPTNELMAKFGGPILVTQGILDPLNDAKKRANLLKAAWRDVEVVEIEGGHCVHDERPQETSQAIAQFILRVSGKKTQGGGREKEVAVPVSATVGSG